MSSPAPISRRELNLPPPWFAIAHDSSMTSCDVMNRRAVEPPSAGATESPMGPYLALRRMAATMAAPGSPPVKCRTANLRRPTARRPGGLILAEDDDRGRSQRRIEADERFFALRAFVRRAIQVGRKPAHRAAIACGGGRLAVADVGAPPAGRCRGGGPPGGGGFAP